MTNDFSAESRAKHHEREDSAANVTVDVTNTRNKDGLIQHRGISPTPQLKTVMSTIGTRILSIQYLILNPVRFCASHTSEQQTNAVVRINAQPTAYTHLKMATKHIENGIAIRQTTPRKK